jgi:hypothetical protein
MKPRTYYWTIHHRDGSTTNYKTARTRKPFYEAKMEATNIARIMGGYKVTHKQTVILKDAA